MGKARAVYATNLTGKVDLTVNTIDFEMADNNMAIAAKGNAKIATTILGVIGIKSLNVLNDAGSGLAKAKLQFGGQGGSNLENSLMLDVTGSMCDNGVGPCSSGTKMNGLKEASKKLVDMVVPENQGSYYAKLAIVPFSTRVRVGADGSGGNMMKDLTDLDNTWSGWNKKCVESSGSGGSEGGGNWTCTKYQAQQMTAWRVMPCVTDRYYNTTGYDYTDNAPGAGRWLNAHGGDRMIKGWDSTSTAATTQLGVVESDPANNWNYHPDGECADVHDNNEIQPLTTNQNTLKDKINGLRAYGSTSGALGTAWAWYTLSPKWNSVWTGQSRPAPYADITTTQQNGKPLLRKVAVLMSDGVYNTFRGWKDQNQQTVSNHAKELCKKMKAEGIEIFTVGLALNELPEAERVIAEATLKACGTDLSHFYSTLNVQELEIAFQDIAYQMTSIALER